MGCSGGMKKGGKVENAHSRGGKVENAYSRGGKVKHAFSHGGAVEGEKSMMDMKKMKRGGMARGR